jgi:hypothetical protein
LLLETISTKKSSGTSRICNKMWLIYYIKCWISQHALIFPNYLLIFIWYYIPENANHLSKSYISVCGLPTHRH